MRQISILGSGWLGEPLTQNLQKQNTQLKVSSRSLKKNLELKNRQDYLVNIENLTEEVNIFLDSEVLIINIPSKNVQAFRSLIQKIELSNVKKVLFISSTSVCRDKNLTNPCFEIENLFINSQVFETTILRFSGLIGYSRNPANFVKNKKVMQNANTKVNLIHRDDCIDIINAILEKNIWKVTLNATADTHPSKREFYTYVCQLADVNIPDFEDTNDESNYEVSNEKLKSILDYKFIHPDLMKIVF